MYPKVYPKQSNALLTQSNAFNALEIITNALESNYLNTNAQIDNLKRY